MASPTIQFKRGLFVNLPSLLAGEPGFTTDRSDLYVGNGDGNKFFGSHRYWTREDGTNALEFKLVDKDGDSGVSLRAPASVSTPVTYTLPEGGGTQGHFLKLGASGVLEWASATSGVSYESAQFTGIATFSGAIDANDGIDIAGGLNVTGGSDFDSFDVSGIGTIATADINGGNIDGTVIGASSAAEGTFTHLEYNSSSTSGISTVGSLYVGSEKVLTTETGALTLSNIDAIDAVTKATLETTLALDPNDFNSLNVTGIGTIGGQLDADGGLDVTGHSELDDLNVSGVSTFSGLVDANGGLDVTGHSELDSLNVTGLSTFTGITTFTDTVYVASTLYVGGITIDGSEGTSVFGEDISVRNISASGVSTFSGLVDANGGLDVAGHSELDSLNVSGLSTFTGAIDANGGVVGDLTGNASTATKLETARTIALSGDVAGSVSFDGTADVTITATVQANSVDLGTDTTGNYVATVTGTANQIAVSGSGSETAAVSLSLPNDVIVTTSVKAPTLKTAAITHSDGASALTIDASGNVGVATNLTVTGDLNVLGSTTTVNTETLLVKDSLIEVGLVDSSGSLVAPSSDANIDVGMIFHYYDASAKKAAVYWDDSTGRLAFASEVSESNSVITATTYATILAGGLEINNACTGGTDEVITCVNGSLALSNIVVDGGEF